VTLCRTCYRQWHACGDSDAIEIIETVGLEAKDVLPNTNRTPKGPKNAVFVPADLDLDLQTRPSEGPRHPPCEFGINSFSDSRDISYTNKETAD